jgi:uncharacterized protein YggE
VETEHKLLTHASQENNEKANKVIAEIKKLLGKDDTIKTSAFNVYPVYQYTKDNKNILTGYKVTNSINIRTKKIAEIGKIIDTGIKNGANRADSLYFTVENKDKYSSMLLKQATTAAKQKALITAQTLGVSLKGVRRVSINSADEIPQPNYRSYAPMMAKGMAEDVSTPIEAGEVKLNATVMVDFIIDTLK